MGEALGLDKFDLIFLDFNMPDGNGLQALDAIHFDDHNRLAAVIMVTGIDDSDTAIAAMKHGCSDFIKKDAVSVSSVRRATINALQKASLNRGLETQTVMRSNIETVLDQFTKQCAEEFRPMLFNMMRHVRNLHTVRLDEDKYNTALKRIEISCGRLFDFMEDIEEKDRKDEAFSEFNNDRFQSDVAAVPVKQAPKRKTLFGQRA
ncbi:MAG: response regulator [Yoonia sp.]|nr:response regulator [Yoonia sp.]